MKYTKWKSVRLGDVADIQTGPFGSQLHQKDYVLNGTPIITVEHLGENQIIHENLPMVSDFDKERLKKYSLKDGDIVFSRVGSVDRRALVKKEEDGWLFSGRCLRVRSVSQELNSRFLSYFFGLNSFKEYIRAIAVGSTMPSLNTKILSDIEIPLPPLSTQRRIAEILSALDDKIELNRQMNATQEAMAQAIFKEWFVDFNFPGATGEMVESELGMIPKGWRVGRLGDIVSNYDNKRVPLSSRERAIRKGKFPYYGAASIIDYIEEYLFDGVYLLMGEDGTVITKDGKPILQYVSGKFWVNNHAHVLQGKGIYTTEYIYLLLNNTNIRHIVTGAVQPKINQQNMNNLRIINPDSKTLGSFQRICSPIFSNILENEQEAKTLQTIRDALIPRLIKGLVVVAE